MFKLRAVGGTRILGPADGDEDLVQYEDADELDDDI
jgi:hypothetical protein